MGGKSSPPTPDYAAAAREQGATNLATAQQQSLLNNPNMVTPYGSSTYTEGQPTGTDPTTGAPTYGRPTLNQTLTPEQQALFNTGTGLKQGALDVLWQDMPNVADALIKPFNYKDASITQGGFDPRYAPTQGMQYGPGQSGPIQGSVQPGQNFIPSVEQAQYAQGAMFLDPQFKQASSDLTSQLANQGITPGSAAYDRAMQNFGLQKTGAYQNLINNSVTSGQEAARNIFGMNLASGQFANTAQGQQFQQLLDAMQGRNAAVSQQAQIASNATGLGNAAQQQGYTQSVMNRTLPINMLTAMLGLGQVQNPTFQATQPTAINAAPIMQGAGMQGQQAAANQSANAGKFGSGLGALGQIGAASLMGPAAPAAMFMGGPLGR